MSLRTPVNFVGAGSYIISGRKNCLLESMLGTCIGITICDPTANVGGLIHLLLPEPPEKIDPWQPEKYAATGLPIFIDALLKAGASRERMRACIAGGALIDPVCDMDISLDIGGRTFEIAEQVLRKVGIPIVAAETGGFFSCRLNLNLQTWESRIAPTDTEPDSENISIGRPLKEELSTAIEQVKPIPQVALKIIRMIGDSNHGMREIAKDVRTDQVL
ncbi:MAG TPA: hypothetical protein VJ508_12540, partial [Saprospiraceae bacterium]|nr:hypothetical protein [Saprospiraceae bacterium]